ncbi:CocE/NonD family hydrolase [Vibrio sp. SS-MA-C1-2]|uniref:CocE/NonD family hydrolase n=1 Tax=Vibrio sp. SS-MA-C1-2 TaxID=2908646 RepID=UPI001F24E6DC|nr:CocE/NonD family hydrolase [Vibrio sp. SS-MA-C1-2]UJF17907.1 CocE/NonD family hydrolase [Vibrio sp. SS-MA-C1-2]
MEEIIEIHHAQLPLPDKTKLAYRAWMPKNAEQKPVPVILEFLPYRKNDGTIVRDEITMPQTAAQGYACVRVDLRGCGESEGLFDDEYSPQELQDGCDVITWLAEQPWCDGNIGMVGISWGGFNSLQIAALQPPALKAIITQCSTDDRYRDDIHYSGGCLLNDNMDWAAFFWAYAQARSPDPKLVGENWLAIWKERLEKMPFLAKPWIKEQRRTDYWKQGSVCENYDAIKIPVYAMSGWADGYRNTVFTLLSNLKGPKKGLVGPWAHKYPNIAYPAPQIDYVKESVRWWDRWLKNQENGIDTEPKLHYYLQDSVKPQTDYQHRAGQWVSEPNWPSTNTEYQALYFTKNKLSTQQSSTDDIPATEQKAYLSSPQTVGLDGGRFCVGIRLDMEHPDDQRIDDAGSLFFDSEVLTESTPIAGEIIANLAFTSKTNNANLIVRVCDVHPNGEVTKITHGILNLSHRQSHEHPTLLKIDNEEQATISLNHIAYVVPKGHQVRVSLSTAYWPLIWPSSEKADLNFNLQQCKVTLPLNKTPTISSLVPPYNQAVEFKGKALRNSNGTREVTKDYKTGITTLKTFEDFGHQFYDSCETEIDFTIEQAFSIHKDDPTSAKNEITLAVEMGRENWRTAIKADYQMTCDRDYFYIKANWSASYNNETIFNKHFDEKILRDFV